MKPLRILYVTGEQLPHAGGSSTHIREISKNLEALGHSVTIVAHRGKGQPRYDTFEGLTVLRTNVRVGQKTLPLLGAKLLHMLHDKNFRNFDVVMERYAVLGGAGAIIATLLGIPYVIESNGPHIDEARLLGQLSNPILIKSLRAWKHMQIKKASCILLVTNRHDPEYARQFAGTFAHKVQFIYNGVNTDKFSNSNKRKKEVATIKKNYGLEGKRVFLFVGSFKPWMGVRDLVDAAALLKKKNKHKGIRFLIVGSGHDFDAVQEQVRKKNVEDICILTGKVPYQEISNYYAAADVGVAPFNRSYHGAMKKYGFYFCPVKILEYMATSLPVITTDIHELSHIVHDNKGGLLFKEGNAKSLADAICGLIKPQRTMGSYNRRQITQKFTWMHIAQQLDTLFEELTTHK